MRLYSNAFNSAGERVRIALALKQVEYEYTSIQDLGWDAYEEINPQRLLPTLEVGGALLTQSTAILEYLEETVTEPALLPADPLTRAKARAVGQVVASEMHAIDVKRVRGFLTRRLGVPSVGTQAWTDHWFESGIQTIETLLARRAVDHPYCYSEQPGWADLFLVPQLRKSVTRFRRDISPWPRVKAIYERCIAHPAFQAAAPEHQSDFERARASIEIRPER